MARSYRHIKEYEKEIYELKERGLTNGEIANKFGFELEQVKGLIKRHNINQRKIAAGIAINKKGRPPKDYQASEKDKLTQSYGITPSMSRRGNPYDNALAENFFSILKTECIYRSKLRTYEEARLIISENIHFYNYQRIQLKTKLTPMEYRCQFVT